MAIKKYYSIIKWMQKYDNNNTTNNNVQHNTWNLSSFSMMKETKVST